MIEFVIKYDITGKDGMNKIWSGSHWTHRAKLADKWRLLTMEATQKIPKRTFENPVFIEFMFESNLDIDNNHPIVKEIIDSLVKLGWIVNDTRKHVVGYSVRFKEDEEFEGKGVKVKVVEV